MAMTNFLLDTNILSELSKREPDTGVTEFVSGLTVAWLSVITLHELEYGVALLPEGKRRRIENSIGGLVTRFGDYIIPLHENEAHTAAIFRVSRRQQGNTLHLADSLIAGTASVHHLTVATRNTKDFEGLGVEVFNPFADEET